tara:strand:- start:225 stop:458 length:234 start_codon:yes stop_codon:yes gene_type:complete
MAVSYKVRKPNKTVSGKWDKRTYLGKMMQASEDRGPLTTADKIARCQEKIDKNVEHMKIATNNIISLTNKIKKLLEE